MIRRLFTRWLPVVAIAAIAATAAIPTTASAATFAAERPVVCPSIYPVPAYCLDQPIDRTPLAGVNHKGWVYLNLNYCEPGRMCAHIFNISTPAWRWNGRSWVHSTLRHGWVYVYPYSGDWRWAWTQESGWVAIRGHRFEIR